MPEFNVFFFTKKGDKRKQFNELKNKFVHNNNILI